MGPLKAVPLGFLTISPVAATGFVVPAGANMAIFRAVTASANWRDDGTAPTAAATGGMTMAATDPPFEYWGNLAAIQFISATGSVLASFYKVAG